MIMTVAAGNNLFYGDFSALRSRFFAPLYCAKRAPLRSGRGQISPEIQLIKIKSGISSV